MYPLAKTYKVPRLEQEPYQRYNHRCWFVAKQNPKTETELNQAIKWSIIDAAIQWDKCEYSADIMDIVERMKVRLD